MNRLSSFARRIFDGGINAADAAGVAMRNTTPNIGKFHASRSRMLHESRPLLAVHEALQRLGWPATVLGKGVTYRKEKAHA